MCERSTNCWRHSSIGVHSNSGSSCNGGADATPHCLQDAGRSQIQTVHFSSSHWSGIVHRRSGYSSQESRLSMACPFPTIKRMRCDAMMTDPLQAEHSLMSDDHWMFVACMSRFKTLLFPSSVRKTQISSKVLDKYEMIFSRIHFSQTDHQNNNPPWAASQVQIRWQRCQKVFFTALNPMNSLWEKARPVKGDRPPRISVQDV